MSSISKPRVSTTQLSLQRLEGIVDSYEPATLPKRPYKRNPFARQTDDTEFVFKLTTQETPATARECQEMQAEVEEDAVMTEAIQSLQATVGSVGRKRRLTFKVKGNEA